MGTFAFRPRAREETGLGRGAWGCPLGSGPSHSTLQPRRRVLLQRKSRRRHRSPRLGLNVTMALLSYFLPA